MVTGLPLEIVTVAGSIVAWPGAGDGTVAGAVVLAVTMIAGVGAKPCAVAVLDAGCTAAGGRTGWGMRGMTSGEVREGGKNPPVQGPRMKISGQGVALPNGPGNAGVKGKLRPWNGSAGLI